MFGYHLIQVHEIREEQVIGIEVLEGQIRDTLLLEERQEAYEEYVAKLREQAEIIEFFSEE